MALGAAGGDWRLWMAFDPVWSPQWVLLGYATALRATAVLAALAAAAALLRRAPAAVRAGLWACALLAVLPLPAVRVLSGASALCGPALCGSTAAEVAGALTWRAHVVPGPLATPMVATGATLVAQSWPGAATIPWTSVVGVVWAGGAGLVLLRLAWGWAALMRLARGARPVEDPVWRVALDEARAALGVRRRVRLLAARGLATPLTCGTLWPTVLVPEEALGGAVAVGAAGDVAQADGESGAWPEPHRRAVLLHELAHVRRLDCLLALLGHVTCALWWCHPGVWWAAHRLRVERERACDARVLGAGVRPSDYAECLLRVADARPGHSRAPRPLGPAVVAAGITGGLAAGLMRRSDLAERIRVVLTPAVVSRRAPGRLAPGATALAGLALVAAAGTVRLAPRPAVLWAALASPAWATRATAAEGIARYGDARSIARLDAVLARERDPRVRVMAQFGAGLRDPGTAVGAPFGWPRPPAGTAALHHPTP